MKYLKLFENFSNKTLINIDIQPAYSKSIDFLNSWVNMINSYDSNYRIIFMYNGDEYDYSQSEYIHWLNEIGINEEVLENSIFYSKYYSFFRYPMDFGIDEDSIVNLVKFMIENKINDSRDINKDFWNKFIEEYGNEDIRQLIELSDDCIYIPELISFLKNYSNIIICGGGRLECLKEVEIALKALDKSYETYDEFIY